MPFINSRAEAGRTGPSGLSAKGIVRREDMVAHRNFRIEISQCALKLWRLQGMFRCLAGKHGLALDIDGRWPGLGLYDAGLMQARWLQIRLQPGFETTGSEWYEFNYRRAWRHIWGGRVCEEFGCGRISSDEILSEPRISREVEQKLFLLGLGEPSRSREQPSWLRILRRYPR